MSKSRSKSRLVPETSSLIPMVKPWLRLCPGDLLEHGLDHARVELFDDSPYRPPITRGIVARSLSDRGSSVATTSW